MGTIIPAGADAGKAGEGSLNFGELPHYCGNSPHTAPAGSRLTQDVPPECGRGATADRGSRLLFRAAWMH
ncbi:MAG: hypothetical protein K8R36_23265 [Planctomycetales bacterium]|nr:hypothetical protein [Planctomycetales bacterium]